MAKHRSIPPFPSDIDRDYFRIWLAGLTAGEGYFVLRQDYRQDLCCYVSSAVFGITLRLDDMDAINLIHSFMQCGVVRARNRVHPGMKNAHPCVHFLVSTLSELARVVVPFFDGHPLIAKKRRDFTIWREGVLFCYDIKCRKRQMRHKGRGTFPKWTTAEIEHFASLSAALKKQREYGSSTIASLPLPPEPPEQTFFGQSIK